MKMNEKSEEASPFFYYFFLFFWQKLSITLLLPLVSFELLEIALSLKVRCADSCSVLANKDERKRMHARAQRQKFISTVLSSFSDR